MNIRSALAATVALAITSACVSTESVTNGGATGVDSGSLLLIDTDTLNREAAAAYNAMLAEADGKRQLNRDTDTVAKLRDIGDRLIRHVGVFRTDAARWDWEINLVQSDQLNAFCMPGGKIAFYSGIIDQLELNDDEIAAIMGHEIAHALREHSNARISRAMWTDVLAMGAGLAIDIDATGLGNLQTAKQLLLELPHSRKHESEADIIGIELAARAGFNPAAAVRVWQKMAAQGGSSVPEFQSTHPSHSTRISNIRGKLPVVNPLYADGAGSLPPVPDKNAEAASMRLEAVKTERQSFEAALAEIEALRHKH